jgi:hypothetical protein
MAEESRPESACRSDLHEVVTTFPLMEGYWGDDLANKFVGEIFNDK